MSNIDKILGELMRIDGASGAAVVDAETMMLASQSDAHTIAQDLSPRPPAQRISARPSAVARQTGVTKATPARTSRTSSSGAAPMTAPLACTCAS